MTVKKEKAANLLSISGHFSNVQADNFINLALENRLEEDGFLRSAKGVDWRKLKKIN